MYYQDFFMFDIFVSVFLIVSLIYVPLVIIFSAIFVYKDAKTRGENAAFWTVFDIFCGSFLFIGPLFYIYKVVKPFNEKNSLESKKIPLALLVKAISSIVYIVIFTILGFFSAGPLFLLIIPIYFLLVFSLPVAVTIFTYYCIITLHYDAKVRKANVTLWSIFAIFFSTITIILYLFLVVKKYNKNATINGPSSNDLAQLSLDTLNIEESKPYIAMPTSLLVYAILGAIQLVFITFLFILYFFIFLVALGSLFYY